MNRTLLILICFSLAGFYSCKSNSEGKEEVGIAASASMVQVQGHRGDRGNFPENSIPAFLSAVRKGVDVLELDVVISKDKKVVVSHEPYMSSLYVSTPAGDSIRKINEKSFNLFEMTYDSIREYDAGMRGNRFFPGQEKMATYKPLLSEVIDSVETYISAEGLQPVTYNIELKSVEAEYGKYQPEPEEFVELVMEIIREKGIIDKINIQSFDPQILKVMNNNHPETELAYLVNVEGIEKNLSLLGFKPDIYSPNFNLVKKQQFVDTIRSMGMKVIPWTVNEQEDIQKMKALKVDGIITDYPERVLKVIKKSS